MVLRPGLFHSIKNQSNKNDVVALEFETPYIKKDLIRFKDKYGRQEKGYETKNFMVKLKKNNLRFSRSKLKKKNIVYSAERLLFKMSLLKNKYLIIMINQLAQF